MDAQTPAVDVEELRRLQQRGPVQIVDVREDWEWNAGHIPGAVHVPLSELAARAGAIDKTKTAYLHCGVDTRSRKAAVQLRHLGWTSLAVVLGGYTAWSESGFPLVAARRHAWSMQRQVRFGAGLLVLLGAALGWKVHPGFYALCAFVGAGLAFSGATDICPMAGLLGKMPWNKGE